MSEAEKWALAVAIAAVVVALAALAYAGAANRLAIKANDLSIESNRIAAEANQRSDRANEIARLAPQRELQYGFGREIRTVMTNLMPRFDDELAKWATDGYKLPDDELLQFSQQASVYGAELDAYNDTLYGLWKKLHDEKTKTTVHEVLRDLGTILTAVRSCGMQAQKVVDSKSVNGPESERHELRASMREHGVAVVNPAQAAYRSAQNALDRLDELDRVGFA